MDAKKVSTSEGLIWGDSQLWMQRVSCNIYKIFSFLNNYQINSCSLNGGYTSPCTLINP